MVHSGTAHVSTETAQRRISMILCSTAHCPLASLSLVVMSTSSRWLCTSTLIQCVPFQETHTSSLMLSCFHYKEHRNKIRRIRLDGTESAKILSKRWYFYLHFYRSGVNKTAWTTKSWASHASTFIQLVFLIKTIR